MGLTVILLMTHKTWISYRYGRTQIVKYLDLRWSKERMQILSNAQHHNIVDSYVRTPQCSKYLAVMVGIRNGHRILETESLGKQLSGWSGWIAEWRFKLNWTDLVFCHTADFSILVMNQLYQQKQLKTYFLVSLSPQKLRVILNAL